MSDLAERGCARNELQTSLQQTLRSPLDCEDSGTQLPRRPRARSDGEVHQMVMLPKVVSSLSNFACQIGPRQISIAETVEECAEPANCAPAPPAYMSMRQLMGLTFAVFAGMLMRLLPLGFEDDQVEAHRCLGILVFVAACWGLEPIPSHVTALLVPFLVVIAGVMRVPGFGDTLLVPADMAAEYPMTNHSTPNPGDPMRPAAAAAVMSASFFDPMILLFIGGFAMAGAMDKHHISQRLAVMLLSRAGTRPSRILLAVIVLGVVLSMWLSNVAAAVLLTAIVRPVLRELPSDSEWPKMVLLGIAFSCNLGGMASPIASPQNVIAVSALRVAGAPIGFAEWCMFAVPFVCLGSGFVWLGLRLAFKTRLPDGVQHSFDDVPVPQMGLLHVFVVSIVALTVLLWVFFDSVQPIFGNLGVVALLPVVLFHGTKVLSLADFNSMPWNVLVLMGGGLALGNAVQSSGLLDIISAALQHMLAGHGLWLTFVVFNLFTGVVANFLSSTVCGIIMMPAIAQVGQSLGHPWMLAVSVAVMMSGAMMLPVSSFPNANSSTVLTKQCVAYLTTADYLRVGGPITISLFLVQITVGYGYLTLLGW
eukprot:TRINITY_DN111393_c0_g1_i1.p1 TRINITY_DN111393_c0_g1~~TRINITY_DN111393_c0_g1_i1.p1  ORF type:complete len:592 (+),score=108.77 TRINITY_DN111393_c0_g1_i1:80-1855(+)